MMTLLLRLILLFTIFVNYSSSYVFPIYPTLEGVEVDPRTFVIYPDQKIQNKRITRSINSKKENSASSQDLKSDGSMMMGGGYGIGYGGGYGMGYGKPFLGGMGLGMGMGSGMGMGMGMGRLYFPKMMMGYGYGRGMGMMGGMGMGKGLGMGMGMGKGIGMGYWG